MSGRRFTERVRRGNEHSQGTLCHPSKQLKSGGRSDCGPRIRARTASECLYATRATSVRSNDRGDPFAVLDQEGVGKLVKMAVELGRKTNPKLEIGICGEHGGEPNSVQFCYRVGMNYVSCSPYRVPIARLAAAQAAISGDKSETQRTA